MVMGKRFYRCEIYGTFSEARSNLMVTRTTYLGWHVVVVVEEEEESSSSILKGCSLLHVIIIFMYIRGKIFRLLVVGSFAHTYRKDHLVIITF